MRLVEPEVRGDLYRGYKASRYEVWLGLFDPKFFGHFAEEFLLPHYSLTKYQWGAAQMKPKIDIEMEDSIKPDEVVHAQRDRSFELYPRNLQKEDSSETPSQTYVLEYSALEHFIINYVQISARRRIKRRGRIVPSEVQPFLLI